MKRLRLTRRDFLAASSAAISVTAVSMVGTPAQANQGFAWGTISSVGADRIVLGSLDGLRQIHFAQPGPETYDRDGDRRLAAFRPGDQVVVTMGPDGEWKRLESCYVHSGGAVIDVTGQRILTSDGREARLTATTMVARNRRNMQPLAGTEVPIGLRADVTSLIDAETDERVARLIVLSS